uniref:Uncharacterized protein n=1 Tax=Anguilla anguilla TaxID=7936 RepID=A0A0E9RJU1_ANGAN
MCLYCNQRKKKKFQYQCFVFLKCVHSLKKKNMKPARQI